MFFEEDAGFPFVLHWRFTVITCHLNCYVAPAGTWQGETDQLSSVQYKTSIFEFMPVVEQNKLRPCLVATAISEKVLEVSLTRPPRPVCEAQRTFLIRMIGVLLPEAEWYI